MAQHCTASPAHARRVDRGSGQGAAGPDKLVLEARLVCGHFGVLFLVECKRLMSAKLRRLAEGEAKAEGVASVGTC